MRVPVYRTPTPPLFSAFATGLGLAALALALASACNQASAPKAGQSGSENLPDDGTGGNTVPCPCLQRDALRVTVLAQQHGNLTLRVEEVLHGELPLVPGDVIEADRHDDTFACYRGCAPIADGEQALAFYRPTEPALPPCDARDACVRACEKENATSAEDPWRASCQCRAEPPAGLMTATGSPTCGVPVYDGGRDCDETCAESTLAECVARPEQDYKRGHVGLSPWTDPIVFARTARGEVSLPRGELDKLWQEDCQQSVGDWSRLLRDAP